MVTLQENSVAVQTWLLQESLLKGLLEQHVDLTASETAAALLADWPAAKNRFMVLVPPSEREAMGLVDKQAVAA